jgi:nucleoside-diphosphate-sugar epimerase
MTQSFSPSDPNSLPELSKKHRRVLVTGAAGRIGSYFAEHTHEKYDLWLRVLPTDDAEPIKDYGQIVEGNLENLDRMKELCAGIDTVLHLAGNPSPDATWNGVLHDNIIGTYNVFVAAKSAGCRRVVYASSVHAISGYPCDVQVKTNDPVNPGDLYGVSKCFGEAMARYMAEQEGLSSIVLRIGAFQPPEAAETDTSMLDTFVSQRDLNQLLWRSIDVENLKFAILHGLSDNRFKRMDISDTRALVGFAPEDDSTELHKGLRKLRLNEEVVADNLGDGKVESGLREDL